MEQSFNPLQVSYKLHPYCQQVLEKQLFQSLIGQLQTLEKGSTIKLVRRVSIPYRLATNERKCPDGDCLHCRFQSLIGQLQTNKRKVCAICGDTRFNPLQVSYKLEAVESKEGDDNSFNPLQVSYKQSKEPSVVYEINGFNPLQVSYKPILFP